MVDWVFPVGFFDLVDLVDLVVHMDYLDYFLELVDWQMDSGLTACFIFDVYILFIKC